MMKQNDNKEGIRYLYICLNLSSLGRFFFYDAQISNLKTLFPLLHNLLHTPPLLSFL